MRKNKARNIDTSLSVIEYITIVDSIVNGYFDDITGEYQAHMGLVNTMTLFYNNFYKTESENQIINLEDADGCLNSQEFLDAYNLAITSSYGFTYDFANAYCDAMDMVETKKMSLGSIVDGLSKKIVEIFDMIKPALSDENIGEVLAVAKNLANSDNAADAIFDSYGKSDKFKGTISSSDSENTSIKKNGNIITLDHERKKK